MQYKVLSNSTLDSEATFLRPSQELPDSLTLESAAMEAMTDLTKVSAVTISPCASMAEASERMIASGVRQLFVINQHNHIMGIITTTDLEGEKPMLYIQEVGGKREDIMVRDIMTKQTSVDVLGWSDVATARVGDIAETLKRMGRQHALVIAETGDGKQTVRGIFSAKQISQLVGSEIDTEIASNFSDMAARHI